MPALAAAAAGELRAKSTAVDRWAVARAAGAVIDGERSRHALRFAVACASLSDTRGPLAQRTFERYRARTPDPAAVAVVLRRLG